MQLTLQERMLAIDQHCAAQLYLPDWEVFTCYHCFQLIHPMGQGLAIEPSYTLHLAKRKFQRA
jgi:hypothetical protein